MIFLIVNLKGALFLFIGCAMAFGVGAGIERMDSSLIMAVAGFVVAALDIACRGLQVKKDWFDARHGGMLFFLPVWLSGAFFAAFGGLQLAGMITM